VLKIRSLTKSFSASNTGNVLGGVDLDLAPGEFIAITGESGVGKSTLLNLIAGLDHYDSGSLQFEGQELASLDDDALTRLRRARVGFVFQAFHLLPYLTVAQNVALPLALQSGGLRIPDDAMQLLSAVGLAQRAHSLPTELSGGEMQRVAIARALVHRPALVLADEPTGNLDADHATQILDLFRTQVKQRGTAVILVTHSAMAAESADRICALRRDGLHPV
jgi:putative ABC transport system ATP-binding protein